MEPRKHDALDDYWMDKFCKQHEEERLQRLQAEQARVRDLEERKYGEW